MLNIDIELLSYERSCAFTPKEVFCIDCLTFDPVNVLQFNLDGILWMRLLIRLEPLNRPRTLHLHPILFQIRDEDPLNKSLM